MPDGGRLTIKARNVEIDAQYASMNRAGVAGRYVSLQVADEGCGMTREVMDFAFDPFFTTKASGKGTGLGLSTALGIVRSHGGFVNVISEVGAGSVFTVYLPAASSGSERSSPAPAAGAPPHGNGELIMLVDDEAPILSVTTHTLEAFGYRTLTAEDGAQAIGVYAMHRDRIAVVITDMMMPVMDGPALIAALYRINPRVRIIAASGLSVSENMARAAQAGVRHFLAKPYSADAMLRLIREVLAEGAGSPPEVEGK
jgi:two-component system, cell cycle sensor histidine kinase and response regulator CckA